MKWIGAGGFELKMIETLAQYLNFSYEIINCNNVWGSLITNQTWNGIIGLLVKNVRILNIINLDKITN